ncbi:hypothetical protein QE410_003051 [Microbacterium sp. SORGH_AS 1204]|nr:hypothetical protein [Microbacterium sp. SORGH_AS_1204]
MTPALAVALARAEAPSSAHPLRVSTTRRAVSHRFGVFSAFDGLRPRRDDER